MNHTGGLKRITLTALLLAALCSRAVTQKFWIVDSLGAGNFRTVSAAFAAASDGDTILVLAGIYPEVVVTSKGLSLIGIGMPTLDGIRVNSLAASKTFVIKGLQCRDMGQGISLSKNLGAVHLENIVIPAYFIQLGVAPPLNIHASPLVTIAGCDFAGYTGASISDSTVYFVNTQLRGSDGYVTFMHSSPAQPGLLTYKSKVILAGTSCTGGRGTQQMMMYNAPAPGIHMQDSEVYVTGDKSTSISAGGVVNGNHFSSPAIIDWFGGSLYIDPAIQLSATNTSQLIQGIQPLVATIPALVAEQLTSPYPVMKTALLAPQGFTSALFVGLPGRRLPLPPHGDLWLDMRAPVVLIDVGQVPLSGSRTIDIPIPNGIRRGLPITFQSLTLSPGSNLYLSTPATLVLN